MNVAHTLRCSTCGKVLDLSTSAGDPTGWIDIQTLIGAHSREEYQNKRDEYGGPVWDASVCSTKCLVVFVNEVADLMRGTGELPNDAQLAHWRAPDHPEEHPG